MPFLIQTVNFTVLDTFQVMYQKKTLTFSVEPYLKFCSTITCVQVDFCAKYSGINPSNIQFIVEGQTNENPKHFFIILLIVRISDAC